MSEGGGPVWGTGRGPIPDQTAQRQSRRQIAAFLLVVAALLLIGIVLGALQGTPLRIGDPTPVATGVPADRP